MHIYVKNTLLILKKQDTTKIIKYAQLKNILASKDNRYNYYFFISLIFLSLIMENRINEAYIGNLSKYMHLLSVNEIFEEIKKVKAFINSLKPAVYNEKNKTDSFKKAISTISSLSKLYFSKSAE